MKHKLLIYLLSSFLLISCHIECDCRVPIYYINQWYDLNTKQNNFYDLKVNVSAYFDDDYLVFGVILGKNKTCNLYKEFFRQNNKKINYDLIEFEESTGQKIIFNDVDICKISSTRTIKVSYAKFDDEIKEIIERKSGTYTFCDRIFENSIYDETNKDIKKVQYGDDLNSLTF